jgi:hypothetical protein
MPTEIVERWARDRWQVVQEMPRLCYAISNVIVYVDTASLSRDFSGKEQRRGKEGGGERLLK